MGCCKCLERQFNTSNTCSVEARFAWMMIHCFRSWGSCGVPDSYDDNDDGKIYHLKRSLSLSLSSRSKRGLTSEAVNLFKRSIELDSNFAEPLSSLASLYSQLGNEEDANKFHLRAIHLQPNNPDMINNYGAFLQKIGKFTLPIYLATN